MNHRLTLLAALSIPALAGVALAAFIAAAGGAPHKHPGMGPGFTESFLSMCGLAPSASNTAFYAEMDQVNGRMHEEMAVAPSGNIDRDFVRMMIPHHQGAIDMALVILKYGRDERLRRLAQSIIVEQGQEIAYMRALQVTPPKLSAETTSSTALTEQ